MILVVTYLRLFVQKRRRSRLPIKESIDLCYGRLISRFSSTVLWYLFTAYFGSLSYASIEYLLIVAFGFTCVPVRSYWNTIEKDCFYSLKIHMPNFNKINSFVLNYLLQISRLTNITSISFVKLESCQWLRHSYQWVADHGFNLFYCIDIVSITVVRVKKKRLILELSLLREAEDSANRMQHNVQQRMLGFMFMNCGVTGDVFFDTSISNFSYSVAIATVLIFT